MTIPKPIILSGDESALLAADVLVQEKSDGHWAKDGVPFGPHLLNAEKMRDGSFIANDLIVCDGQDIRRQPFIERWRELKRIAASFTDGLKLCETGEGIEFHRRILERGGEGTVAKELGAAFGWGCVKVKRIQVFYCRVTALDPVTGGVWLADRDTGEARGKLPLRGGKFERVRGGSILKLVAFGLTAKGLLREVRCDSDSATSWLANY